MGPDVGADVKPWVGPDVGTDDRLEIGSEATLVAASLILNTLDLLPFFP